MRAVPVLPHVSVTGLENRVGFARISSPRCLPRGGRTGGVGRGRWAGLVPPQGLAMAKAPARQSRPPASLLPLSKGHGCPVRRTGSVRPAQGQRLPSKGLLLTGVQFKASREQASRARPTGRSPDVRGLTHQPPTLWAEPQPSPRAHVERELAPG